MATAHKTMKILTQEVIYHEIFSIWLVLLLTMAVWKYNKVDIIQFIQTLQVESNKELLHQ